MAEMLEQLQLPVGSLGQNGGTEGLHDFFNRHWLCSQLVFGRAVVLMALLACTLGLGVVLCDTGYNIPDQSEGTHSHRLQFRIPRNQVSTNIPLDAPAKAPIVNIAEQGIANRLVISKVVPKIWARTNSAMMEGGGYANR